MIRIILAAVAVALLMTETALAQSYCDQVRQAVAIYGLDAARQHAMAHYGPEAVRMGDGCLNGAQRFAPARNSQIHADQDGRYWIALGTATGVEAGLLLQCPALGPTMAVPTRRALF